MELIFFVGTSYIAASLRIASQLIKSHIADVESAI